MQKTVKKISGCVTETLNSTFEHTRNCTITEKTNKY